MSNHELATLFFLQLAIILVVVRLVGYAARYVGQPQVVGELIGGVLIGPSLFGALLPQLHAAIFPAQSVSVIYAVSQVGLALYMFLVGMKFDLGILSHKARTAIFVSAAGIAVPFGLGAVLGSHMLNEGGLFTDSATRMQACLFLGAAISVTAFPMLARMIYEWRLTGTPLGTLVLAAASTNDAAAWCILAIVLASFTSDAGIAVLAVAGGLLYVFVLFVLLKPALGRLASAVEKSGMTGSLLGVVLILLALGAWFTDRVGIYSVFGSFFLGLVMPRGAVTRELDEKLEPLTANLLVPLFFVYAGLNADVRLLWVTPGMMWLTLVVTLVACLGKGGACWLAARLGGEDQRTSITVGALMNARGLMELILLNIGLQYGLITPTLYTILVIMTVVTTLMAAPLFHLVYGRTRGTVDARRGTTGRAEVS